MNSLRKSPWNSSGLVAALWALGPIIDNAVEPKLKALAPQPGDQASPASVKALRRYMVLEVFATGLFYVFIVTWMLL